MYLPDMTVKRTSYVSIKKKLAEKWQATGEKWQHICGELAETQQWRPLGAVDMCVIEADISRKLYFLLYLYHSLLKIAC